MVAINFPVNDLITNVTTHQIGAKSWVWNGSAWDKATTDSDHGHSGGDVVDSFNGATGDVIGVSSVCGNTGDVVDVVCSFNGLTGSVTGVGSFDGLTGSVLARNILPHIHLAGISSDGGATFGGIVNHSSDVNITGALDVTGRTHFIGGISGDKGATFSILQLTANAVMANANGIQVGGDEPLIKVESNNKVSLGDPEDGASSTKLVVDDSSQQISFDVDQRKLEVNAGDFKILTGISAAAGATFAGLVESSGISCGASTVGSVLISSGVMVGTATAALSASTATSATTATNVQVTAVDDSTQYRIPFAAGSASGSVSLGLKTDSGSTSEGLFFRPDVATLTTGTIQALGVTLGNRGITFADGTGLVTATRTDSYTGQIETASDKTYVIDPSPATARTITGYFIKSGSGTVTATLKNAAATVKAASVSTTSGVQSSLGNTSVSAGATMSIVTSSNSSATDVIFSVEYTTTS